MFGRKRKQEIFDRAYAEFISGNIGITINNTTQLIHEGYKNFNVFNLRAKCYMMQNKYSEAFQDAKKSVQIEANIEKNSIGYAIRNQITEMLKSGQIHVTIFELINYFRIENVVSLYIESAIAYFSFVHSKGFQDALNAPPDNYTDPVNLTIGFYINLSLYYFNYRIPDNIGLDIKRELSSIIDGLEMKYITLTLLENKPYNSIELELAKLNFRGKNKEQLDQEFFSSYSNKLNEYSKRIFKDLKRFDNHGNLLGKFNFPYCEITNEFIHYLEKHVIQDPFATKKFESSY